MAFVQKLKLRDAATDFELGSTTVSGDIKIAPISVAGTVEIGTLAARTGAISLGSDASTAFTNVLGNEIRVRAKNGLQCVSLNSNTTVSAVNGAVTLSGDTVTATAANAMSLQSTGGAVSVEAINFSSGNITRTAGNISIATDPTFSVAVEGVTFLNNVVTGITDMSVGGDLTMTESSILFTDTGAQSINKTNGDLSIVGSDNLSLVTGTGATSITAGKNLDMTCSGDLLGFRDLTIAAEGVDAVTYIKGTNVDIDSNTGGSLDIGTSATKADDITIGNGIAGATGDVLVKGVTMKPVDGSWTPVVGGTGGTNYTQGSTTASYWRWGRMCVVSANIVWTAKNAPTGQLTVSGFPFTVSATTGTLPNGFFYGGVDRYSALGLVGSNRAITIKAVSGTTTGIMTNEAVGILATDTSSTGNFAFSLAYMI